MHVQTIFITFSLVDWSNLVLVLSSTTPQIPSPSEKQRGSETLKTKFWPMKTACKSHLKIQDFLLKWMLEPPH